jgi:hypothetical protein
LKRLIKILKNENTTLLFFALVSMVIGITAVWNMPLFSDSAFHATIVREIYRTGNFPTTSAVGWTTPDINPLSFIPFLTHPPLFYLDIVNVRLMGVADKTAFSLIAIIPTSVTSIFFYKLIKAFFNRRIAFISTLFLVFMPMGIWLVSHRIMEPLQYLMSVCLCYYCKYYLDTKNRKFLVLAAIFASAVLYIKITSFFIVLAVLLWLIAKKVSLKNAFLFLMMIFILYSPYIYFSVNTRGTVSYSEPGFPVIDKYIFNPWWNWTRNKSEQKLNKESGGPELVNRLANADYQQRDYIQKDVKSKDFLSVLQNYSIYPVSKQANIHWFSPLKTFYSLFALSFILGIFIYVKKYRETGYHYLVIPLFLLVTYYLTKTAELRYFFILNIILIPFSAISLSALAERTNKFFKLAIYLSLLLVLVLIAISEINHSHLYEDSLRHNYLPKGQGVAELEQIKKSQIVSLNKTIFTPATSDVAYYMDRQTVWDYRLFFIKESDVPKYLNQYHVSEIVIPKFFITSSIISLDDGTKVPNTRDNWAGYSIPLDSGFYKYLRDTKDVKVVQDFKSFTLYRRIDE